MKGKFLNRRRWWYGQRDRGGVGEESVVGGELPR